MTVSSCIVCGKYWAHNAGPLENFRIVTRWCPPCLASLLPVMGRCAA